MPCAAPDHDLFTPCRPTDRGCGPLSERFHAMATRPSVDGRPLPAPGCGIWTWPAPHDRTYVKAVDTATVNRPSGQPVAPGGKNFAFAKKEQHASLGAPRALRTWKPWTELRILNPSGQFGSFHSLQLRHPSCRDTLHAESFPRRAKDAKPVFLIEILQVGIGYALTLVILGS